MAQLIGLHHNTNANGELTTTLHLADDFNVYYSNEEAGRSCVGKKVETIYVGTYDCTNLKVGMEIEVLYDKAVSTAKGIYQPIKRIVVLSKP